MSSVFRTQKFAQWSTWLTVALFHPDVAVVLCHPSLRVQEGHAHAAFSTETSIVAATVFDSLPVELITEPERRHTDGQKTWQVKQSDRQTKCNKRQKSVVMFFFLMLFIIIIIIVIYNNCSIHSASEVNLKIIFSLNSSYPQVTI